jgi:hypothetical protein
MKAFMRFGIHLLQKLLIVYFINYKYAIKL